jgi:DNA-binding MarR family transcriptional regulator
METTQQISQSFTRILHEWVEVFMHRSMHDFIQFSKDSGLTMSQLSSLFRLYHGEVCGVSEIGDHLGVTNAAASQMVERLVQLGLLERREGRGDRRIKNLVLTESGRQLVLQSIEARRAWMEKLTVALTPDDQASISSALVALTEAARQLEKDPHILKTT